MRIYIRQRPHTALVHRDIAARQPRIRKDVADDREHHALDRPRDVGVGSAAGVAVGAIGSGPAAAKPENADERKKARYRESDHVKTYYKSNRY